MQKHSYSPLKGGSGVSESPYNRGEELHELDRKRQQTNIVVIVLAVAGVMIGLLCNELMWHNRNIPVFSYQLIKLLNLANTAVLFYYVLKYYSIEFELLEVTGKTVLGVSYWEAFRSSGLLPQLVIETCIIIIQPLPFVNYHVHVWGLDTYCSYASDGFIAVFMFLRLYYYTPRIIAEASGLKNEKTRLIGLMNNVDISYNFIVKAMLRDSLLTLLFLFVVSVVTLSYAMLVFERPIGPGTNLDLYENTVWLIIITMTTVGYGDTYPQTPLGRYVAIIAALLAVVLVALAVGSVTERLTLTRDESKVLEFIESIRQTQERKMSAARMLQRGIKSYIGAQGKGMDSRAAAAVASEAGFNGTFLSDPSFYKAALDYAKIRREGVNGISTDVALTVTETSVSIRRLQTQMEALESKLADMHDLIKTAALGGAQTKSTRW